MVQISEEGMARINREAEAIYDRLSEDSKSIITIIMIISIVISVLRLLNNCRRPVRRLLAMKHLPSSWRQISKIVSYEVGLGLYKEHGDDIVEVVFNRTDEIQAVYIENLMREVTE